MQPSSAAHRGPSSPPSQGGCSAWEPPSSATTRPLLIIATPTKADGRVRKKFPFFLSHQKLLFSPPSLNQCIAAIVAVMQSLRRSRLGIRWASMSADNKPPSRLVKKNGVSAAWKHLIFRTLTTPDSFFHRRQSHIIDSAPPRSSLNLCCSKSRLCFCFYTHHSDLLFRDGCGWCYAELPEPWGDFSQMRF